MTIDERLEALAQSVELLRSRVEHPQPDQVAVVTIATPPHSSASAVAGTRACRRDLRRALSSPTPRFRHQKPFVNRHWETRPAPTAALYWQGPDVYRVKAAELGAKGTVTLPMAPVAGSRTIIRSAIDLGDRVSLCW